MTPKKTRRWMNSVIAQAAKTDVQMPWARGERRAEMMARREDRGVMRALETRALRAS